MKTIKTLWKKLWNDEHGFIVSAELVLVTTITVLSTVVGLSTVSHAINGELYDVADAFSSVNQGDDDYYSNNGDDYGDDYYSQNSNGKTNPSHVFTKRKQSWDIVSAKHPAVN